jgi:hypothetical protein
MKMTMHIDEDLLSEVMRVTGASSKTAAVNEALRKVASKFRQRERWKSGLGMSAVEIRQSFDATMALGLGNNERVHVSETPKAYKHGRKRSH